MNDHFREVRNMISDTPRMHSALIDAPEAGFAKIWQVGCDIERELTTAQERIKRLEEDLMDAKNQHAALVADVALYEDRGERIKRLEEDSQRLNWLLNRGLAWRDCYNDWWKEGEWLYASQSALETIDNAKEAKP